MAADRQGALERLAAALGREFEAPVGIFDRVRGEWIGRGEVPEGEWPMVEEARPVVSSAALARGEVMLWSGPVADSVVWLILPLEQGGEEGLTAWVGFTAPGVRHQRPWGTSCPPRALVAWGREVQDRLLLEKPSRPLVPLSAAPMPVVPSSSARGDQLLAARHRLSEDLIWKMRVSDPPEKFQQLAVRSLQEILDVEAVAWVPYSKREPVVVHRIREGIAAEGFRGLLPDSADEPVRRINDPKDERLGGAPGVQRLLAVVAGPEGATGWLVAINPSNSRSFGAEDAELIQPVAALIHAQRTNSRHYGELKDLLFGVIRSLTAAIDAKDPYTRGHSERVGRIAVQLAESLGLPANERGDLYLMGLLHDVGKIGVEDAVLKKNGPLDAQEYSLIQQHVRIGVEILKDLRKLQHLLPGVHYHHENYDGSGYPCGLAGEQIPLPARILAVADAYDAMSSNRPYRDRLSQEEVERNFRRGSGTQWDPQVVEALFRCRQELQRIRQKGLGESVLNVVDETLGRS